MTKYLIDGNEVSKEEFYSELEDNINTYVETNLDDLINECYEEVHIGICTFTASEILKKCDPVAYRCISSDFVNSFYEDAEYEVEHGGYNCTGVFFEIVEEEEDEENENN